MAGVLLTGGASRRMGSDKASLLAAAGRGPGAETLAKRNGRLLAGACHPCVEVGPGRSGLDAIVEDPPGAGPLVALAAAGGELRRRGWLGPALVVATDLPALAGPALGWLACYPSPGSVVPVTRPGDVPQPLCARWSGADLALASRLVAAGARAMRDLVGVAGPALAAADGPGAPGSAAFADADTPGQARALGLVVGPPALPPARR